MTVRTSDEVNEIADALAAAQATIENVGKDGANPHFRSRYATLSAVLDEVRPKFAAQGIAIVQMAVNGEGSNIGVITRLAHKSGQWIESGLYVAPMKFDAQGAGSVISYLRRYSLMAMAGVGQDDDDGTAAVGRPEPQARRAAPEIDPFEDALLANHNATANGKAAAPVSAEAAAFPNERERRAKAATDEKKRITEALGVASTPGLIDKIIADNAAHLEEIKALHEPSYSAVMALAGRLKTDLYSATG